MIYTSKPNHLLTGSFNNLAWIAFKLSRDSVLSGQMDWPVEVHVHMQRKPIDSLVRYNVCQWQGMKKLIQSTLFQGKSMSYYLTSSLYFLRLHQLHVWAVPGHSPDVPKPLPNVMVFYLEDLTVQCHAENKVKK